MILDGETVTNTRDFDLKLDSDKNVVAIKLKREVLLSSDPKPLLWVLKDCFKEAGHFHLNMCSN